MSAAQRNSTPATRARPIGTRMPIRSAYTGDRTAWNLTRCHANRSAHSAVFLTCSPVASQDGSTGRTSTARCHGATSKCEAGRRIWTSAGSSSTNSASTTGPTSSEQLSVD